MGDKTSDDNLKGWQQYLDATVFSEVSDWTMLPSRFMRSTSKSFRNGQRKGRQTLIRRQVSCGQRLQSPWMQNVTARAVGLTNNRWTFASLGLSQFGMSVQ